MTNDFDVTEEDLLHMRANLDASIVRARPSAQGSAPIEETDVMAEWQTEMRQTIVGSYDGLVALAHLLTGGRESGETLARTALLSVFSGGSAPADATEAEYAVRREILVSAATREPAPIAAVGSGDAGDMIAQLTPRERVVMVARYVEGLTVDQTADILGVSPTAVRADTAESVKYLNSVLGTQDPLTGPIEIVAQPEKQA